MSDCVIDWLIDRLSDWSFDWWIDWLICLVADVLCVFYLISSSMEDASREAASFGITNEEIQFALEDMSRAASIRHPLDPDGEMCEGAVVQERIKEAMQICRQLMEWMMQMGRNIPSSGYQGGGSTELVGADFLLHLNNVGLGPDEFDSFREAVAAVDEDKKGNASGQSEGPEEGGGTRGPKTNKVSGITLGLLKWVLKSQGNF